MNKFYLCNILNEFLNYLHNYKNNLLNLNIRYKMMMYKSLFLTISLILGITIQVTAQYNVGHTTFDFLDTDRSDRNVYGEIYYPATSAGDDTPFAVGEFPLLVFGHGFVMAWSEYDFLWEALVEEGYIIAFPRTEGNISPSHEDFGKDLAFLVDKFQTESSNSGSFYHNKITDKSAVMGHSMGGGASFLAAANNPNITTMINYAAAETTPSAIAAAANISIPSLIVSGSSDCVAPADEHQDLMYDALASSYKAQITITEASHCQFGKASSFSACTSAEAFVCIGVSFMEIEVQHNEMLLALIPWLDFHLRGICSSWDEFENHLTTSTAHTYRASGDVDFPAAETPVISGINGELSSTPAMTYEWYYDGDLIEGATSQNYTATEEGIYLVEITDENGCPALSEPFNVTISGLNDLTTINAFSISPNPVKNSLFINLETSTTSDVQIAVVDITGRVLKTQHIQLNGSIRQEIDVNHLSTGVYFVKVKHGEGIAVKKFIKL